MVMVILALFSWWYTEGWVELAARAGRRVQRVSQVFSVGLLAKTLFSPFRQISADSVQGSANTRMRAFGDRLFSRMFGAVVRGIFILIGTLGALLAGILGLAQLIVWPLLPVLPFVGAALAAAGWVL